MTDRHTLELEDHQHGELPKIWITQLPGTKPRWITQSDYNIHVHYLGDDGEWKHTDVLVPFGFEFDLASIPRFAWRIIAPFELSLVAPLVHDWIYHNVGLMGRFSRREADRVFRYLMEESGIAKWRVKAAYSAVRLFGGRAWKKAGERRAAKIFF